MTSFRVLLMLVAASVLPSACTAAERFGRPVVPPSPACLQISTMQQVDGLMLPTQTKDSVTVGCIVYRGSARYYVEVFVSNGRAEPISMDPQKVVAAKPGFTFLRTSTLETARSVVAETSVPFQPSVATPSPRTTTAFRANGSSSGNSSMVSGTASTEPTLEQSITNTMTQVNYGLANSMAASNYKMRQEHEASFGEYLRATAPESQQPTIAPGESRTTTFTYLFAIEKRGLVSVKVSGGEHDFMFEFAE